MLVWWLMVCSVFFPLFYLFIFFIFYVLNSQPFTFLGPNRNGKYLFFFFFFKYARSGFLCWDSLRGERWSQCCKEDQGVTGDTPRPPAWFRAHQPFQTILCLPTMTLRAETSSEGRKRRRGKKCGSMDGLTSAEVRGSACGWGADSPPSQHGASIRRPCGGVEDRTCQPLHISHLPRSLMGRKMLDISFWWFFESSRVQCATCTCVALVLPSTFGCHGNSEASGYLKSHWSSRKRAWFVYIKHTFLIISF